MLGGTGSQDLILPFLRGAGNGSQFCSLHSQARRGVSPVFYVGVDHVGLPASADISKEEDVAEQRRENMLDPAGILHLQYLTGVSAGPLPATSTTNLQSELCDI